MDAQRVETSSGTPRQAWLAASLVASIVAGCASSPPAPETVGEDDAPSAVEAPPAEFEIQAGMLDAWNAVGQVLVRTEGVTYESRAQMLGLYAVHYRGERVLILTRARVMQATGDREVTRVYATAADGSPNTGPAATGLIAILRQRLPGELALIAAGGRGTPTPPTPAPTR